MFWMNLMLPSSRQKSTLLYHLIQQMKLSNVCYCDETNGTFYFILVAMFETKIPQHSTLYTQNWMSYIRYYIRYISVSIIMR